MNTAADKRRAIALFVEFVRYCAAFAMILALALISLHFATAATV